MSIIRRTATRLIPAGAPDSRYGPSGSPRRSASPLGVPARRERIIPKRSSSPGGHDGGRYGPARPLVDRPRPTYPPLAERVAEVRTLARDIEDAADPLLGAARALNRAALIASDCGLPELARELCRRQIAPYRNAGQLTVRQATRMLEPVVNLARLRIRGGDAETAWASLSTLYHALQTNTLAIIEGRSLPTQDLIDSPQEQQELRIWAYRVYLSEGTRALVRLGRWQEALRPRRTGQGDRPAPAGRPPGKDREPLPRQGRGRRPDRAGRQHDHVVVGSPSFRVPGGAAPPRGQPARRPGDRPDDRTVPRR